MTVQEFRHADAAAQSAAIAATLSRELRAALAARPSASLVVSGGRSPEEYFRRLATTPLEWARVQVTLADERWVAADDGASNERLLRAALLQGAARGARLVPLKNAAGTPEAGAVAAWGAVSAMPRPFDAVVLGMGDDGHTASLFPCSAQVAQGLDPSAAPGALAVHPVSAPHARVSLNRTALLGARRLLLQISGLAKWAVYQRALREGPEVELPVRAFLRQSQVPVEVHWCPAPGETMPAASGSP